MIFVLIFRVFFRCCKAMIAPFLRERCTALYNKITNRNLGKMTFFQFTLFAFHKGSYVRPFTDIDLSMPVGWLSSTLVNLHLNPLNIAIGTIIAESLNRYFLRYSDAISMRLRRKIRQGPFINLT